MSTKLWPHSIMVIQTTVYHKNELDPRQNKTVINAVCRVMAQFKGLNANLPLRDISLKLAALTRVTRLTRVYRESARGRIDCVG